MKMLIGGAWVDASDGRTFEVTNPFNGELIDTVPCATREDVTRAVDLAVEGQKIWNGYNLRERSKVLRRFIALVHENRKLLAETLTRETGKPIGDSYGEVDAVEYIFEGSIEIAKHQYGATMPRGTEPGFDDDLQVTWHEPKGIIACIVPFNFPLALWAYKAGPSLMTGNAILTKPASYNPLAVTLAMGYLVEAGVTGNACQCLTGGGATVGDWIAGDPRIAVVNMTGGTKAGLSIAATCAKNLTEYRFELGGNDPLIVLEDGDLDLAVSEAEDRTRNAGQCCSGTKRFIVHNSLKDAFVEKLIENVLKKLVPGDPMDPATTIGTVIDEKSAVEIERQIALTVSQGARLVYGGTRRGAYVEPAVLTGVTGEMDVARDMEIFGPVFPVIGFDTVDEAIKIAENSCYGLGSGVITPDIKKAMKVAKALRVGHVAINASGSFRAAELPFGGGKKFSGNSRECLSSVLDEVTQVKSVIFRYAMESK